MATQGSSNDPYAPFYYWDYNTNNWAFDYQSYYATYGYPQQQASSSQQTQQYPNPASTSYNTGPFSGDPTASAGALPPKEKKPLAGPKDAEGNLLAGRLKKGEKRTTVIRTAGDGTQYEDASLLEWDPTHKRLFVGDLGNDVNDATLADAFKKYPSFSKARVVRKKTDFKSKGFGFVAFADPEDYLKAWKEMNGKYIGSRPCRLKAAESNIEQKNIGYRQDRILANNVKHQEFKAKYKMGGAIGGQLRRHGVGKAWASK